MLIHICQYYNMVSELCFSNTKFKDNTPSNEKIGASSSKTKRKREKSMREDETPNTPSKVSISDDVLERRRGKILMFITKGEAHKSVETPKSIIQGKKSKSPDVESTKAKRKMLVGDLGAEK